MNPKLSLGSPSSEVWAAASLTQKVLVGANRAWVQGLEGGAGRTERERDIGIERETESERGRERERGRGKRRKNMPKAC